ncbi:MAG: hypothetical protein Q6L58_06730, partial [Thermostichales cyanobacterium BF3_bins_165]
MRFPLTAFADRWYHGEHDACGVGFVADSRGRSSHRLLQQGLKALDCMEHRGGCGGDQVTGDGAGIT